MRTQPSADQPSSATTITGEPWRDPALPVEDRVADLLARMTLAEKLAQLVAVWVRTSEDAGDDVAPMQGEFAEAASLDELIANGLGQLTRVFGTAPVSPAAGVQALARLQRRVMAASRFGIPAIAHEECLAGLTAWTATIFPTPLAWGASFDPDAVREMAAAIGQSMRAVGVHQGLAPVLDVSRDPRWGRAEETIGEDPYLVGMIGTAYVQGLESAGLIATLKHFAGYSASRAARNMAPTDIGPRALADVILPPFEMAIRDGGARAVMPSYAAVDGVPSHADDDLLTARLRGDLGFTGTVVSDYFGVSFLETLHGVAGSPAEAAAMALRSGVDTELPHQRCYAAPLAEAVRSGLVSEGLVDRAAARVLRQKFELGLLDPGWVPNDDGACIDLNPHGHRQLARRLAEESVVLLANVQGLLPLRAPAQLAPVELAPARLALVGPLADEPLAGLGCYSFPRHVGYRYPDKGAGVPMESLLAALREELPDTMISHARGCDVRSADQSGIAEAAACAAGTDVALVVLGDEAGLFGRGSSGEGCDVPDLRLPGVQQQLLDAVLETGVPVVLVLITGRPYAIGGTAGRLAAAIQSFFPGQEGMGAIARVLSGRVTPSGKLPMEMPAGRGAQPTSYLRTRPAERSSASAVDPTPLFAFGHGLSYTSFEYSQLSLTDPEPDGLADRPEPGGPEPGGLADGLMATDGAVDIGCMVRNSGLRAGAEVVQLYLRDPVAQVTRPVRYLAGFARVTLAPGESRRVTFRLHADRTAFAGRSGPRVVEPGRIDVLIGSSSADIRLTGTLTMHGPERVAGPDRVLSTPAVVSDPGLV
jgi:beta-xylosidase